MTKICVVCKLEPNPNCTLTFHKFPKNDILKQKWISALQLTKNVNSNTTYVCSNHFLESDFFPTSENRQRTRLLTDAVPSYNKNSTPGHSLQARLFLHEPKQQNLVVLNDEVSGSSTVESRENDLSSPTTLYHNADQTENNVSVPTNHYDDDIRNNRKRKLENTDTQPRKRVRLTDGTRTELFSRKDFSSEKSWSRFVEVIESKQRKQAAIRQKNSRNNKKLCSLKGMVKSLEENNELDAAQYLQDLPPHIQELIERMKNNHTTQAFPTHLKTFARTLHFHSPSAYEAVRRSFLNCLPSPQTLNKWICKKQYKPGVSEDAIRNISGLVQQELEKGKKLVFNLTFDEMHIKKHREWDKVTHSWKGCVDLGGQLEELDENGKQKIASKVLVFMLVTINSNFKIPVAHYLISSLNGVEKSILIKDLLIKLQEHDITVVSLTFDGDPAHKTACEALGAQLNYKNKDSFKPFFQHPIDSHPIFIFYDPCHCLKLVRNYFAIKGPLIYNHDEYIDWKFIKMLNDKQQREKLHCACKVKNRHVDFHREKMKVFLAAQVLSSSTSHALNFLETDLKDPHFAGASYTATFCRNINDIFDLLNAKNKFCKTPGRSSINKDNIEDIKIKIDNFIEYIEKIEVDVPVKESKSKESNSTNKIRLPVVNSNSVNTGFVGFIISLNNLYNLSKFLLDNDYIDFFLSYKLSQDHLEMVFSFIRRKNGFNNNPTATQYLSAYKKLLINKLNVNVSSSANCMPLDKTFLITEDYFDSKNTMQQKISAMSEKGLINKDISVAEVKDLIGKNYFLHWEHDYTTASSSWSCSEYADEIIKHTAGFIARILKKKIHCQTCCDLIDGSQSDCKSKLSVIKNRGGLHFASDDVISVCRQTEKSIRQCNDLCKNNINKQLIQTTLTNLPRWILDNNEHFMEQELLQDHRSQLITMIVQAYIDIRLKHESSLYNDETRRVRMINNKVTIFKGQ